MKTLKELLSLSAAEKEQLGVVHTPKEIAQQPQTWRKTYQDMRGRVPALLEHVKAARVKDPQNGGVLLVGAGTSDWVARTAAGLLRKQWNTPVQIFPSTDLLTHVEEGVFADRDYLCISTSRSGTTSEAVAMLDLLARKYPRIRHIVLTCNAESDMAQKFGQRPGFGRIVLDDAVNDRGMAMTSSYTNMVLALQLLALGEKIESFSPVLDALVEAGTRFLDPAAALAQKLSERGFAKVCFLGSGPMRAVASESGLKVLEMSSGLVTPLSDSYLGIRHGPLAAVHSDTLVVGFVSSDPRVRFYELELLQELRRKKLGQTVVAVAAQDAADLRDAADHVLASGVGENVEDAHRVLVDVLFGQLLGLFAALKANVRPDLPKQNAINRVVTGIRIL